MPRYGDNSDRKTSGIGLADQGRGARSNIDLPAEQLAEVERLSSELREVVQRKNKISQTLSKINQILINFDQVVAGDVIINILPDTTLEEVKNSPILSYREVNAAINQWTTNLNLVSRFREEIAQIFGSRRIQAIIKGTDDLKPSEMYAIILKSEINALPSGQEYTTIKRELTDIISSLEAKLI